MTIPYYENCRHKDEGWCGDCVKKLGDEHMDLMLLRTRAIEWREAEKRFESYQSPLNKSMMHGAFHAHVAAIDKLIEERDRQGG